MLSKTSYLSCLDLSIGAYLWRKHRWLSVYVVLLELSFSTVLLIPLGNSGHKRDYCCCLFKLSFSLTSRLKRRFKYDEKRVMMWLGEMYKNKRPILYGSVLEADENSIQFDGLEFFSSQVFENSALAESRNWTKQEILCVWTSNLSAL